MKKKKNKECIAKSGWLQHSGEISVSEKKKKEINRGNDMWSWQQEKKFIGRHMIARWHKTIAKLKGYKMTKKQKKKDNCQALSYGYFDQKTKKIGQLSSSQPWVF